MSDLTATHCGCSANNDNNGCGCGNILWLVILLALCGNNSDGCGNGGSFFNGGNSCNILFLLLLVSCLGNGGGSFFGGNGCGCGC